MSNADPKARPKPGPWPPASESSPMQPSSWAKRTGFRPKFSGEANAGDSGQMSLPPRAREPGNQPDLEAGRARPQPQPQPPPAVANGQAQSDKPAAALPPPPPADKDKDQSVKKRRDSNGGAPKSSSPGANRRAAPSSNEQPPPSRRPSRNGEVVDVVTQSTVDEDGFMGRPPHMKYELRDSPGLGEPCAFPFLLCFVSAALRLLNCAKIEELGAGKIRCESLLARHHCNLNAS